MCRTDVRLDAEKVLAILRESGFSERNLSILMERMRGAKLQELGDDHGISPHRARDIVVCGLMKARSRLWKRGLRRYFND